MVEPRSLPAAASMASSAATPNAQAKRCPSCSGRFPIDFRVCPRDATPLQDAEVQDDPVVGSVLSDTYQVLRPIGEGGMGRVYEASHLRLGNKRFAIKVLHHEYSRQPEVLSRFQREAEAASALSHPNVIDVVDVNRTPDGRPYIVAELLQGEDLGALLEREGRLPMPSAIRIVRQVCAALSAAHARGIVHRDIKPENVFLVGDPSARQVKVLDFGISKLGDASSPLTQTGVVMGTPAYMPPEQARGGHVDYRADIYSVGAILYRALTGSKPFEASDTVATLTAVVADEPRRPSTIERSIPPALELVIQKAMAKNPDERYASLDELDEELAAFAGESTVALEPTHSNRSASRPGVEPMARTMLDPGLTIGGSAPALRGGAANGTVQSKTDAGRAAGARSSLVLLTVLGLLWLLASAIDASITLVRWLHGAELSRSELNLCVIGVIAVAATPATLWIRFLAGRIWPNTPRAVDTAARMRSALQASLAMYAVATVAVHGIVAFAPAAGLDGQWPGWRLAAFAAAWLCSGLVWLMAAR